MLKHGNWRERFYFYLTFSSHNNNYYLHHNTWNFTTLNILCNVFMNMLYNIGIYSSSAKEEWCFSVACRKQNKERMKWSIWAYTYYIGTNFRTQETQVNVGGWSCLYHIMKHILYWLPVLRWKETFLFLSWNNSLQLKVPTR